jgi:hypothetical protein
LASSSGPALAKALYKVPFPWAGIWRAYPFSFASDPVVGKGLRSLIGGCWRDRTVFVQGSFLDGITKEAIF